MRNNSENFQKSYNSFKEALVGMNYNNDDMEQNGEMNLLKMISQRHDEGVVFDVGANIGKYTLLLSKIMPTRQVYSFEPGAITYKELVNSTAGKEQVKCVNIALSYLEGESLLYYDKELSGWSSLYQRNLNHLNIQMNKSEKVRLTTLDSFCMQNKIDDIFFMKIDVEGSELDVLRVK